MYLCKNMFAECISRVCIRVSFVINCIVNIWKEVIVIAKFVLMFIFEIYLILVTDILIFEVRIGQKKKKIKKYPLT